MWIVVNGKSPDQVALSGVVHLAPEGKIDPRKAQGKMEMKKVPEAVKDVNPPEKRCAHFINALDPGRKGIIKQADKN